MRKPIFHAALCLVFGAAGCAPTTTQNDEQPTDGGGNWLEPELDAAVTLPDAASDDPAGSTETSGSTRDTAPGSDSTAGDSPTATNGDETVTNEDHAPDSGEPSSGPFDDSSETGDSTAGNSTAGNSTAGDSTKELDAPALFTAHCASCHGEEAQGKPGEAPEIRHPVAEYAQFVVRNGRSHDSYLTEMPAFDEFLAPDDHVDAILSYLSEFPKPTTGKALFLDYCANCHGADAAGGTVNRPILGMSEVFVSIVRQGRNLDRIGTRNMFMPSWKEADLSDAEITAIGEYVTALDN
jgi:mono/diheme cytochrome c family protein